MYTLVSIKALPCVNKTHYDFSKSESFLEYGDPGKHCLGSFVPLTRFLVVTTSTGRCIIDSAVQQYIHFRLESQYILLSLIKIQVCEQQEFKLNFTRISTEIQNQKRRSVYSLNISNLQVQSGLMSCFELISEYSAGWRRGNTLELYSGSASFEFLPGHRTS